MIWIRRLPAPIDAVWQAVSTLDGLEAWWIVPPTVFEKRPGGRFVHHWENVVADFREQEFIDFKENSADYATTGGMRFELKQDGDATMFMFLDTWGKDMPAADGPGNMVVQPGGLGTHWSGVAAGWHAMVDKLEAVLDGRVFDHTYDDLADFYMGYLHDSFRWKAMVQRGDQ